MKPQCSLKFPPGGNLQAKSFSVLFVLKTCISIILITMVGGCAGSKQEAKPLPEQDKWEKLAEKSEGHSPSPSKRNISISDYRLQNQRESPVSNEKPLPTQKISLKMRNADIKSILRALARATNVNILVKDEVKEITSVDFVAVPWDQVFRSLLKSYGLTYVWEGDILRVVSQQDMEDALKAQTLQEKQMAEDLAMRTAEPLSTVVIPINFADAEKLSKNLQEFLLRSQVTAPGTPGAGAPAPGVARGSVKVDEHSNSLIINATRSDIERMIDVIAQVDKPTPQILIRANIVETTKDVARDLGIQWGGIMQTHNKTPLWITPGGSSPASSGGSGTAPVNPVSVGASGAGAQYTPASGSTGISGQGEGVSFPVSSTTIGAAGGVGALGLMWGKIAGNILETQLQALETDGKANIISSPSLTTLDNQKASTQSGTTVPYVTFTLTPGATTPTPTVNFVDAVLMLEITPHVIDGKNLKMTIHIKKDDVDTSHTVQGNPFINRKDTVTSLIVEDGETIVISGLTNETKSRTVNGVPGLKDVPGLGWLFKGESKDDSLDRVLIFITPHILPRIADAEQIKSNEQFPNNK